MDGNRPGEANGSDQQMALAPRYRLPRVVGAAPPSSVVFTDWPSRMAADGVALNQAVMRQQRGRVVGGEVRVVIGEQAALTYTVHVERQNGVMRDRLACRTLKVHAFAKQAATWTAALSLQIIEHNRMVPHVALRQPLPGPTDGRRYAPRTPAVALGLTDQPWSLIEFLTCPVHHGS